MGGWQHQNGGIFGKVAKRGGGHFQSKDFCCRFLSGLYEHEIDKKKMCYDFPKMRGGVKGRLEIFRKFIHFGVAIRSLEKCKHEEGFNIISRISSHGTHVTLIAKVKYIAVSLYLLQYISDEVMNEKFASSWGIPHLSQASYS